jgi:hypothetical protein
MTEFGNQSRRESIFARVHLQACKALFEMTEFDEQSIAAMFDLMDEDNRSVGKAIDVGEFTFFFSLERCAAFIIARAISVRSSQKIR